MVLTVTYAFYQHMQSSLMAFVAADLGIRAGRRLGGRRWRCSAAAHAQLDRQRQADRSDSGGVAVGRRSNRPCGGGLGRACRWASAVQ